MPSRRSPWMALTLLLMSCSRASIGSDKSVPDSVSAATTIPETSVPTTTLPDTVAARCNRIASQVIEEFVASFNDGVTDLDHFFASGEEFQWFSDDQRNDLGASSALYDPEDRSTLIAYLHETRRTRGPISILSLKFTSVREYDPNAPWAPHGFKIEAVSPDSVRYAVSAGYAMQLEWGGLRWGKSQVDCGRRQIDVWSLGRAIT